MQARRAPPAAQFTGASGALAPVHVLAWPARAPAAHSHAVSRCAGASAIKARTHAAHVPAHLSARRSASAWQS
eukprot:12998849-Alexandrium_andersonii.AAC.1